MAINYVIQIAERNGYYEDFAPYRGITENKAIELLNETRKQFPGEVFRLFVENWDTMEKKTIV